MKNYFEYEVEVCTEDGDETYQGITYGENYAEALKTIIDLFDERDLISVKIIPWDCEGCITTSKEALKELRETIF